MQNIAYNSYGYEQRFSDNSCGYARKFSDNPYGYARKFTDNSYRYTRNLQIILRFSTFFSIFLWISLYFLWFFSDFLWIFSDFSPIFSDFSLIFSEFLRFSLIFSKFLGFSSYLCTRKSAACKKGGGVIIFMKVLKNDEALPSEIDSRAFLLCGPAMESLGTGGTGGG